MSKESIDNLARRLAASLPQGLRAMREDAEENFRAVLKSGLARMDLVTREEFEVQRAVLARTREKLEALEKRVAERESATTPAAAAPASATGAKKGRKKATRKRAKKKAATSAKDDVGKA